MAAGTEYCLLGPLIVRRHGQGVTVPLGKQRALLAALLLRAGLVTGLDELAEALWGTRVPVSARVSLQNYVARLRRVLGDDDGAPVIVTEPGGYRMIVAPGELDVSRFEAALAAGRTAARAGEWAGAARVLRDGLELWRGRPLAGVDSELLAAREGPRLAELRLQALEARIDADLRLGHAADVVPELRELVAEEPLRERLRVLLMTALYRDGRAGDALAAYQDARRALVEELGAEPGPELRELQRQVLAGDPVLAGLPPPAAGEAGPPDAAAAYAGAAEPATAGLDVRYSLPPDTAAFTGRDGELDQITATVADAARGVVAIRAIDGMPGIGKTALAVHAAHALRDRYPDRQLFIDLRAHTPGQDPVPPEGALAGLLTAVGVDPRSLPPDLAGRAALWRDRMAGQRALLVLDNAASSAQVAPLLPGAAQCLVLVTSRRHLADLPGAVLPVLVQTLPPEQAQQMFIRLAPGAAQSPPAAVAELARLAGCLPLAISLLARVYNRHPSWTLADLAAETRASLLTLAAENDSVAAAFEVSWQHLDHGQQEMLALLGLHPGTVTDAYAAAALAAVPLAEAARRLDGLHGEGLLTETGYRRYGMHDLIRRYAADRAAAGPPGLRETATGRLLDYYQHVASLASALMPWPRAAPEVAVPPAAVPDLPDFDRALAWVRSERVTLLACRDYAAQTGDDARLVALTAAMAELFRQDGLWNTALARHAAAVTAARRLGDRAGLAGALSDLGLVRRVAADYAGAATALSEALAIYGELADRRGQARALQFRAEARRHEGCLAAAAADLLAALDICRSLGERGRAARALLFLGIVMRVAGDYPAALGHLGEALHVYRELGDRAGQANVLTELGAVRRAGWDYAAAARVLEEALAIFSDLRLRGGRGLALHFRGTLRLLTGDYPAAAVDLAEATAIYREKGDRGALAEVLNDTGALHRARGQVHLARDCHQQALDLAREITSPWDEGCAVAGLARCALAADDLPAATAGLRQALDIFERIGSAEAGSVAAELAAIDPACWSPAD